MYYEKKRNTVNNEKITNKEFCIIYCIIKYFVFHVYLRDNFSLKYVDNQILLKYE
jgi:hypothetical protein